MGSFAYFAYGSNMLAERLQERCKSANAISPAWVDGYELAFHKRSKDGSGKATLIRAKDTSPRAYGVIFSINASEKSDLDRMEGSGYFCNNNFKVFTALASPIAVMTYLALPKSIDTGLVPYDWYCDLVIAGAKQNALPDDYVKSLTGVAAEPDPNPDRPARLSALELLRSVGFSS